MYVSVNVKSKAELKRRVAAGEQIGIFQPGPFGGNEPRNGEVPGIEGPWYPEPHRFYGTVTLVDGIITKVK